MPIVVFTVPDQCTLLNLAGPVQVFEEARTQGAAVEVVYAQFQPQTRSSAGLAFAPVLHYATLAAGDLAIVPGIEQRAIFVAEDAEAIASCAWLRA